MIRCHPKMSKPASQQRKSDRQCRSLLVGAGGFASRALKNSPPGCFSPAPGPGRAVLISPAHATSKNPLPGCGKRGPRENLRSKISWGSEEQQCKRAMNFCKKIRRKRCDACDELVGAGGFEPPKQLCNRFTVCPHWPLGNTPTCFRAQSSAYLL